MSSHSSKLARVKISEILLSKKNEKNVFYNLRQTFNSGSMGSMKESIAEIGLESPLLIRAMEGNPNPAFDKQLQDGKKYQLIAGERRIRTILKLIEDNQEVLDTKTGKTTLASVAYEEIDVKILYNCDDKTALKLSVTENMEIEQVSQLDLMNFCISLTEMKKPNRTPMFSPADISEIIGRSPTWISQTKSLADLPNSAKELLKNEEIDRSTALFFLKLDPSKIDAAIEEAKNEAKIRKTFEIDKADNNYKAAIKKNEIASGKIALADLVIGDSKEAKSERSLTKQAMHSSKKRREAANKKNYRLSTDDIQSGAESVNAITKKHNPIGMKVIRQQRDRLVEILNKHGDVIHENDQYYERDDVSFVKHILDNVLGSKGKFDPLEIIDEFEKGI